jgi:cell division protein FtsI/penicillin-binding protein 2
MKSSSRITLIAIFYIFIALLIAYKLFYIQILNGSSYATYAASQRQSVSEISPARGNILASDGYPLAISKEGFLLFANPQLLEMDTKTVAATLAPILTPSLKELKVASDSTKEELDALEEEVADETKDFLLDQLQKDDLVWVLLKQKLTAEKKQIIEKLNIKGLGFEPQPIRAYPEASMSSHLLGFIGQDEFGKDIGYFGLEGFYDLDLSGRIGIVKQEKDALNRPIPIGKFWSQRKRDGRHLQLFLNRGIQYLVENSLKKAVKRYEAKSGAVVIMDPKTGGIISLAAYPDFEPQYYFKYDPLSYLDPIVSLAYEPGSTFKVLTMAAGLEEGKIKPDTICDICDKQFKVDKYYIKTWNDKYHPNSTMTEVLAHSDNIGMVFVAKKLGIDTVKSYIEDFGIGKITAIDLQGEIAPSLRDYWSEVDLYTASFGQGILVTPIQMITAVGAIANDGNLMQPRIVQTIIDNKKELVLKPKIIKQVVSKQTADVLTEMMVAAVNYGDAKWAVPEGFRIAGKTGTSQISIEGEYDEIKTIASFVGFAPADDPKFVMLTIINEPQTSEWGSETAAPLFFDIAEKLFIHLGIPKQH